MLGLGLAGAAVVGAISPWLVHYVLKIPEGIQPEVLRAFYLLRLAIVVVASTCSVTGLVTLEPQ
ncbi:MAG: hypothetical protein WA748_02130 [Candidatus Acidiferrum sp.]